MNEYFQAVRDDEGGLRLSGELDLASVPMLREAMDELPEGRALTFDLAELTYVDSSGLHAIVDCANKVNGAGGVRLVNVSPSVLRVLRIVNLDQHPNLVIDDSGDGK
jgi:anti-anti-sigma factor